MDRQRELADVQKRTEQRVEELAQDQKETEQNLDTNKHMVLHL